MGLINIFNNIRKMKVYTYLLISLALMSFIQFSIAEGESCSNDNNCGKGICRNSKCECDRGYVSYNGVCNYQQKDKLTAFLLSILIGSTGADWFYLSAGNGGYITAGVFKLLTGLAAMFTTCAVCCIGVAASRERASSKKAFMICGISVIVLIIICAVGNAVWVVVDFIRILTNSFKDGNGIALKDW